MGQQSLFSYTIKCKSIASNETYVVQKDMQGYSAQFTCLQFVPRDINVVQWRMSSWQHYQGDVTCEEDDLQLDEAPLVYYYLRSDYWTERRNKGRDYMPCPLEGGYIMSWKDKTGRFPCGDVLTTMKLENECSPGEGLIFNGLGPPNGCALPHEKLKEKYFCLGSWQEEDDTFLLLHSTVRVMRTRSTRGHHSRRHALASIREGRFLTGCDVHCVSVGGRCLIDAPNSR